MTDNEKKQMIAGWYMPSYSSVAHRLFENRKPICGKYRKKGFIQWVQQLKFPWGYDRKCKVCLRKEKRYENRSN